MTETETVLGDMMNGLSSSISSKWLRTTRMRLDASYYSHDVFRAKQFLEHHDTIRLDQYAKQVFNLGRFKRVYSQPESGIPYLSASEALFFRPNSDRYLSIAKTKSIDQYRVEKGWIIMTCSGTVGRMVLVGERLSRFAFTHDLMRIVPKDNDKAGYLVAYLSSWIGQTLLTKDQYGSAVKHLESEHVGSVLVPLLQGDSIQTINDQILSAHHCREKANSLLDDSEALLQSKLGLPDLTSVLTDQTHSFLIKASELNARLDAAYHRPLNRAVASKMREGKYVVEPLGQHISEVFIPNRFKRTYVEREQGIPFLQGKQIVETRPYDIKYISTKVTKNIQRCRLQAGWVLVTRSGTVGRATIVPSMWDGWSASEHLLRVVPKEGDLKAGYITAFLLSSYGYYQLVGKIFGAVIDEISENHVREVQIPIPPADIQDEISQKVTEAYELKEQANLFEKQAIAQLEISK